MVGRDATRKSLGVGRRSSKGIVNPGRAYFTGQWREYRFIVTMMLDWCSHSLEERQSLLSDPWNGDYFGELQP